MRLLPPSMHSDCLHPHGATTATTGNTRPRPARGSSGERKPGEEKLALQARSATVCQAPAIPLWSAGATRGRRLCFTSHSPVLPAKSRPSPPDRKCRRCHPKRCTSKHILEHMGWDLQACSLFLWVSVQFWTVAN